MCERDAELARGQDWSATCGVVRNEVDRCSLRPDSQSPSLAKVPRDDPSNPDIRAFVQRLAGYCLTGDVSERILVLMHGYGRNGKSILLRVLQSALGGYAITTMPTLLMAKKTEGHSAEVAHLFGARLALTTEVKKGQTFDEEKIKRLTGNDIITARGMRQDPWSFEPTFKLVVALNHKPQVRDSSDSIRDRIVLIPFDVRIKDADVDRRLFDKLKAELPGVLAWAVEGCFAWQKEGLAIPDAVRAVTKEYRREEDIVGRFFDDCCTFDSTAHSTSSQLKCVSDKWCARQGVFALSGKALATRLQECGCRQKKTSKCNVWIGIRIKDDCKPELVCVAPVQDTADRYHEGSTGWWEGGHKVRVAKFGTPFRTAITRWKRQRLAGLAVT